MFSATIQRRSNRLKPLTNEQKDGMIRSVMGLVTTVDRNRLRRLIDLARNRRALRTPVNVLTDVNRADMRYLRKNSGRSMREIARRAGTTSGFVSQVLSGKRGASKEKAADIWRALR